MYESEMCRTFIQTKEFSKKWEELGFDDEELRKLELCILQNPEIGVLMQGTGGLRKMRFAFDGRGKSGSARICYIDFISLGTVYLVTVFEKNQKANLTKAERNNIKKLIDFLRKELIQANGGDKHE